jgi:hypothetical protein
LMYEQVVQGLDVVGEQSRRSNPHISGTQLRAREQAGVTLCSIADAALTGTSRGCSEKAQRLCWNKGVGAKVWHRARTD